MGQVRQMGNPPQTEGPTNDDSIDSTCIMVTFGSFPNVVQHLLGSTELNIKKTTPPRGL